MKINVTAIALSAMLACSLAQAQATKAPAAAAAAPAATKGQVVKMMWIDPLTGLMGPVGTNQLKSVQFLADPAPDLEAYRADCLEGLRAILGR